jgi:amidase
MISNELWRSSASDLAQAIRSKTVSSREVIEAHLARIKQVNPRINALTQVLAESALAMAEQADALAIKGQWMGPLHGIPFTVKENIDLAGSPSTNGIVAFQHAVPPEDAPLIVQLKAAGAIPIGRSNMPDFGMRWHTDNALYGATINPWNAAYSPGGSSGGEAAALATGMTPLGTGNDYAGSLRLPSQACGTVALRPSYGRVASASAGLKEPSLTLQLNAVQGPMARNIRDLALLYHSMIGPDARDPWWVPVPAEGPRLEGPTRVAVTTNPAGLGVAPEVAAGVRHAADALADAGYIVEEIDPPSLDEIYHLFMGLANTDLYYSLLPLLEQFASKASLHYTHTSLKAVPPLDIAGYAKGFMARHAIAAAWSHFQAQFPLILGPVSTMHLFPTDYDQGGLINVESLMRSGRLIVAANFLGLPALALPVGVESQLPQSVQIIGQRYREDLCFAAAQAIEDRLGTLTPIDPQLI